MIYCRYLQLHERNQSEYKQNEPHVMMMRVARSVVWQLVPALYFSLSPPTPIFPSLLFLFPSVVRISSSCTKPLVFAVEAQHGTEASPEGGRGWEVTGKAVCPLW